MKVKNDDNSQGSLLTQLRREHFGWDEAGCRGGVAGGSISGLNFGKIGTIDIFVILAFAQFMRDLRQATVELLMQGLSMEQVMGVMMNMMIIRSCMMEVINQFNSNKLLCDYWCWWCRPQVATSVRLPQYEHWAKYDEWLRWRKNTMCKTQLQLQQYHCQP